MITEYLGCDNYKIVFSSGNEIELNTTDFIEILDSDFNKHVPNYINLEDTILELRNMIDELESEIEDLRAGEDT